MDEDGYLSFVDRRDQGMVVVREGGKRLCVAALDSTLGRRRARRDVESTRTVKWPQRPAVDAELATHQRPLLSALRVIKGRVDSKRRCNELR